MLASSTGQAAAAGKFLLPCDNQPPLSARQPVTVPTAIFTVPGRDMFAKCRKQPNGLTIYGCTFQAMDGHPAVVVINGDQNAAERRCTLAYEESHLPPNNWYDPVMEAATPDASPPSPRAIAASTGRPAME